MQFSRQEYWSGLPFSTLGIFPTQGSNLPLLNHLLGRQIIYHCATYWTTTFGFVADIIYEGMPPGDSEGSKELCTWRQKQ